MTTLLEAIGLVVLVMFLFLQNWRTTLIPAITIPVSLIGTFAFVKLFGFSINTLTLFGITLATGLVVDDAIVVIENIERHIHEHHRPAARGGVGGDGRGDQRRHRDGARARARCSCRWRSFPGTTGRLYQQFALTIAVSMAISAFNALTLTPALAGVLLAKTEKPKGVFFRVVNRVIDGGTVGAGRRCCACLIRVARARRARVRRCCSARPTGSTRACRPGFVPDEDQGYIMILVQAPQGASLDYTMNIVKQAEQIVAKMPEISTMFARRRLQLRGIGAEPGHPVRAAEGLQGAAAATQHSAKARRRAAVRRVQPDHRRDGHSVPAAVDPGPRPVRRLHLRAARPERRADRGPRGGGAAADRAGQPDAGARPALFTQFTANDPQLVVDIDREQAKSLGMSLGDVTNTMQILLGSAYVNDFDFNNRSYRVYVQADQQFRSNPGDIERYSGADRAAAG